jgi:MFS family permease
MVLMVGVTGRVVARFGFRPPMIAGLALLAAGIALLARLPVDGGYATDILGASLVAAGGMSLAYIPVLIASLSGARPEQVGLASGLVNTSYQVGSALGLATMTAVAAAASDSTSIAGLTDGYQAAFVGAALIAAAAAVVAAGLIRRPAAVDALREAQPLEAA